MRTLQIRFDRAATQVLPSQGAEHQKQENQAHEPAGEIHGRHEPGRALQQLPLLRQQLILLRDHLAGHRADRVQAVLELVPEFNIGRQRIAFHQRGNVLAIDCLVMSQQWFQPIEAALLLGIVAGHHA